MLEDTKCELEADKYSGDTFKCGGATFTFISGAPPSLIKAQGDVVRSSSNPKVLCETKKNDTKGFSTDLECK